MCVCIVSGVVNELRLSHDQETIASAIITSNVGASAAAAAAASTTAVAVINGDIDKLNSDGSIQSFHRRRNWWLSTHATIQKDLLMNVDGRYECPRDYCRKTYKEASSLQRHIRCVF